jgi:hypothetical protein
MKSVHQTLFKIRLLITGLLIITSLTLSAQANYAGGQGGGYSSYTIGNSTFAEPGDSLFNKNFDVTVYPNPLTASSLLKAKVSGIQPGEKISVVVTNMIGSRILAEEIENSNEITIDISSKKLTKGIYLITFKHKNNKITRRFTYSN